MKTKSRNSLLVALLAGMVVVFLASPLLAQDGGFENREYDIGICAGVWFPGEITIAPDSGSVDVDKETSLLARGFIDMYLTPKFATGLYVNFSSFTISYGNAEADSTLYEIGFAFKPRFILSPTMALKPGLNIGYRGLDREELGANDDDTHADGLGINFSLELQMLLNGGYIFFVDGGFLAQPAGGSDDADVTFAPILYLCAGIVF